MRLKHKEGLAASLTHEGKTLTPDEDGYIDVPYELAPLLLNQGTWEQAPVLAYVAPLEEETPPVTPEPVQAPVAPVTTNGAGKRESPAEKAARFKAEAAAKAAKSK